MKASKASVSVVMSARAGARARRARSRRAPRTRASEGSDARGGGAHGADDARRRVRIALADPKRNECKVIVTITK